MMKITGQHPAEDLLLSASMPQSTDLRQIGLVDDIVEKPEEILIPGEPEGERTTNSGACYTLW